MTYHEDRLPHYAPDPAVPGDHAQNHDGKWVGPRSPFVREPQETRPRAGALPSPSRLDTCNTYQESPYDPRRCENCGMDEGRHLSIEMLSIAQRAAVITSAELHALRAAVEFLEDENERLRDAYEMLTEELESRNVRG